MICPVTITLSLSTASLLSEASVFASTAFVAEASLSFGEGIEMLGNIALLVAPRESVTLGRNF